VLSVTATTGKSGPVSARLDINERKIPTPVVVPRFGLGLSLVSSVVNLSQSWLARVSHRLALPGLGELLHLDPSSVFLLGVFLDVFLPDWTGSFGRLSCSWDSLTRSFRPFAVDIRVKNGVVYLGGTPGKDGSPICQTKPIV
jgi:hypothetical protein